ncbi:MAG: ribonuclease PH [Cyanobacteriota bacterium]|nr:ribonuclease PH [Cyanobacteriota bacterium]
MTWQRPDGRSLTAIRPVTFERFFTKFSPGSVLVKCGDTQILCTVSFEDEVPTFVGSQQGWLKAEYRFLPGATPRRQEREREKISGRTAEIQRLIGRSLRSVVDFEQLGSRTIRIDADVLQADGGTRTAAITGGYVALQDAVDWLQAKGLIEGSPLIAQVAAISVGIVQGSVVADLCYLEDSQADVDLNVVMTATGQFVEVQGTAEKQTFSPEQLQDMLNVAHQGIQQLITLQQQARLD